MSPKDEFTGHYETQLQGTYDCVDRVILNAYFRLGNDPGGFRTWWRRAYGDDSRLDDTHLMRMAGRFSRRVRAFAKKNQIPLQDCHSGDRKHEIAEATLPTTPEFRGIFLILVSRAPAPVWHVQRTPDGQGITHIARKDPQPWVNHYFFHILDDDWGHMTIRMCGHPPFTAQVILNGHEYVERQARKKHLDFTKEGNCFTEFPSGPALDQLAETVCSPNTVGQLSKVCDRWIYTCLSLALDTEDQRRTGFEYAYSNYQLEYSRNLLFRRGDQLEEIFQATIDRTRQRLDLRTVLTIFGQKQRPRTRTHRRRNTGKSNGRAWKQQEAGPRIEVAIERPTYDLTVFRVRCGALTVRLYTKGERVLRAEALLNNARKLPGQPPYSLPEFPRLIAVLRRVLDNFLNNLSYVDRCFLSDGLLESLPTPTQVGNMRVPGINPNHPRTRAVMRAVVALACLPGQFKVSDLAAKVREATGWSDDQYKITQASYDLKKLRGKDFVRKVGNSRQYEPSPLGLRFLAGFDTLVNKALKPLLAGITNPQQASDHLHQTPIDTHYQNIQTESRKLLNLLGIAA
jgi:hypothetical protein